MTAHKIKGGRAGSIDGGTPVSALPAMPVDAIGVPPIPIPLTNPVTVVASGLAGAIGCDYIPTSNQLAFVEYGGNVSILNLIRPQIAIVSQGSATLHGTYVFDLDTGTEGGTLSGPGDIWWEQEDTVHRRMVPISSAKIVNLGVVDFPSLQSSSLQLLTYTTTPIDGNNDTTNQLVAGDVFAVQTNAGNFAKVLVQTYGYNLQIQWVTYKLGPAYRVLGTGYANPEDIIVEPDGRHAFVTERVGNILAVDLTNANRPMARVVASGLQAPHQMQFDAGGQALYVVEYDGGRLLHVDTTTGTVTPIATGLDHPIGLLLSSDFSSAYVSEQAATGGRVREVRLSNGTLSDVASGFTAPFMMTWLDDEKERIILCERDPANRLAVIDLQSDTITRPSFAIGFRPSSIAVLPFGIGLVCCDSEIDELLLGLSSSTTGPLFKGIGNVPFDKIFGGLANTTGDPTYFYQVSNAPFGGVLPLRINHVGAWLQGARWYHVLVDGIPRTDPWSDYRWNGTNYQLQTVTVSNPLPWLFSVYPVRSLAEDLLWYSMDLGARTDTTGYLDGTHTIEVQFFTGWGGLVATSGALNVRFENSSCSASLTLPHIGTRYAGADCGLLNYGPTDSVTLSFTAAQPHGFALYSFVVERGVHELTPPSQSAAVPGAPVTVTPTAAQLLGSCTIAGFAEYLYVAATAINGEYRQSQYDASDSLAFVLAPGP